VQLLGLGTHLFVKVPQPGDSEGTFAVFRIKLSPAAATTNLTTLSCRLSRNVPCPKTQQAKLPSYLHTISFNAERQAGKL